MCFEYPDDARTLLALNGCRFSFAAKEERPSALWRRCWSWSNEYHNVHMFYIYSLVLLGLLNSAEENWNHARTNDDVLWDLFVLSKTWEWGGHHVDKTWLTLLPFSGLHLHPPLQSRPPHGSSDLGPCRNKEREGDYKQCFGDIYVSNHCWC